METAIIILLLIIAALAAFIIWQLKSRDGGGGEVSLEPVADKLGEEFRSSREEASREAERLRGELRQILEERMQGLSRSLSEMQGLRAGVDDLNRTLTNVSKRGAWGEVLLESVLETALRPEQYETQASVTGGRERADFVVKVPGRDGGEVLLPIDSKFPLEDYEAIVAAGEAGDKEALAAAQKALSRRVEGLAKDIGAKYVHPPRTTDFAVLFLPTDGLFAEVARAPGFLLDLQARYRVLVTGPTTILALVNTARMSIKDADTMARMGEIQRTLGELEKESDTFDDALAGTIRNLEAGLKHMEEMGRRKRVLMRRIKRVRDADGADGAEGA